MKRALGLPVLVVAAFTADPPAPVLPEPYATPSATKRSTIIGWPAGVTPRAPKGFAVELWADGLTHPRWLYQLPNGDVLVSELGSGNRITLLRDTNGDGRQDQRYTFLNNSASTLNRPFGMTLVGSNFYVANTNGVWRFPYTPGATSLSASSGVKVFDLPADGYNNHWTRNLLASRDGRYLYVTVGSATNVDTEGQDRLDSRRAAILQFTIATGAWRVFANGLRNPNGLDWEPVTGRLWTGVNERDGLGDGLVPDFVTSVRDGGFYGWPQFYFGSYEDPRKLSDRPPGLPARGIVPDLAVGAHTATLGLAFYKHTAFPERFRNGMFIGQHGSWNRSVFAGYRVAFIPFDANGNVTGPAMGFLTDFVADEPDAEVYGRPVCVIVAADGSLLVTDDSSNRIWRVRWVGPDATTPAIRGLMLFNADTDQPIEPFREGIVLDPTRLRTNKYSVVAPPGPSVGSVRFVLDGMQLRVENSPPYTIADDNGPGGTDDYFPWTPTPGPHILEVTPFSGPNATGRAGETERVRFTAR